MEEETTELCIISV